MFGNAEAYDRFMGRWSRLIAPPLLDFASLPEVGQVLDVGSGIGDLAFEVARRKIGLHVRGVDRSHEFVAYATSQNPCPERIRFQVGDAQDLPFADGVCAAALSSLVFNFIPDPAKALRELCRATQPGSRISAAVWDYGERMFMLRAFWDAAVETDPSAERLDEKHMPLCRAGELSELWRQSGLEDVQEQPLEVTMKFDSFMDYWDPFLLGQGPAGAYVRTLDGNRVQILRSAVKRRLSTSSESDAFVLPARVWAVQGRTPLHS